jgi:TRAP-type C4-dicarboxylate transport system substrate-binding protein
MHIFTAAKLHTLAQKFVTRWSYVADPLIFVVNREVWQSWSPADQEIVRASAVDAGKQEVAIARKGLTKADSSMIREVEALGVKVTELSAAERGEFQRVLKPVYDKWVKTIGSDLVAQAEAAVAKRG